MRGNSECLAENKAQQYFYRGNQAVAAGQWEKAAGFFLETIKVQPDYAEAYHNWGFSCMKLNLLDEAEALLRKALEFNSCLLNGWYNLGFVYERKKLWGEAEYCFRSAIELNPFAANLYNNLGVVLEHLYRLDEAEQSYRQAIETDAAHAYAYYNLGNLLKVTKRYQAAEKCLVKACQLSDDDNLEMVLSFFYLTVGRFNEGWKLYGEIQRKRLINSPSFNIKPWWREDLSNSKILIYMGDGLGDTIHFVRYVNQVVSMAANTVLFVQTPLLGLLKANYPGLKVSASQSVLLDTYDFAVSLQSMPILFDTREDNIPCPDGYIAACPQDSGEWEQYLGQLDGGNKFRTGIVWAGNPDNTMDHFRSIPFKEFEVLFRIKEVCWYSLQVGQHAADCVDNKQIIDLSSKLTDFAQTAGAISNLDLVITMDTSVAHLAGAMGKPTWLLLDVNSDWRWLLDREDSPWYSSMRLFRQKCPGDWGEVLNRVRNSLANLLVTFGQR